MIIFKHSLQFPAWVGQLSFFAQATPGQWPSSLFGRDDWESRLPHRENTVLASHASSDNAASRSVFSSSL